MRHKISRQNDEIVQILSEAQGGMSRGQIKQSLSFQLENKTLQRRLAALAAGGRIRREGTKRSALYFEASEPNCQPTYKDSHIGSYVPIEATLREPNGTYTTDNNDILSDIFSSESSKILSFLDIPHYSRPKVIYKRSCLDNYVPNKTSYVPIKMKDELREKGRRFDASLAAGTYAGKILSRLLIDLSYNSSRLEGNTYSMLDTQRLIEQNISAEGKMHEETVMIMNHKEAISFLVENAEDIEPSTFTIYGLHHLLSQDLLPNPQACGRIRQLEVTIGKSAYRPISNPHVLKEMLELLLLKARRIEDPFEQSFFLLVHLSYLQAFEDVNKRTARLACNIPFIKTNLCPLSFTDLPKAAYISALLVFYETNDPEPLLDVFRWAYLRSCLHYDDVRESIGQVDAFRIRYRQERKAIMGQVIRSNLHGAALEQHITTWCREQGIEDVDRFTAMTLTELKTLHGGAIIGLGITENQFSHWKQEDDSLTGS
jgi:Fic family protein